MTYRKVYSVDVAYKFRRNFSETDAKVFRIVGRPSDSSGATLRGPKIRDHSWEFKTRAAADRAARKLRAAKFKVKVRVY